MGHLVRDLTLAKLFVAKGIKVTFLSYASRTALSATKRKIDFEGLDIDVHELHDASQILRMLKNLQPQFVIVDGPESLALQIRPYIPRFQYSIGLDYFALEQPLPKLIINVIDHAHVDSGASVEEARRGVLYREGHEYAIIRDEFVQARKIYHQQHGFEKIDRVLLSFGGADPSGNTFKALEFIWKNIRKVEVVVIAGPLLQENHANDFAEWKARLNLHLEENIYDMASRMLSADVIFCGAGTTLLEAMCVGIPAVVIPQTINEQTHAKFLATEGGCILLDEIQTTENLLGQLTKISTKGRSLVDGEGKMRIYQLIQSHSNEDQV